MKRIQLRLFLLLFFITTLSSQLIRPAGAATAGGVGEGDIVSIDYDLVVDGAVYDSSRWTDREPLTVTLSVTQTDYLQKFVDGIYGMQEGETKTFVIPAMYGYTNPDEPLYGKDLTFTVELLYILHDAPPYVSEDNTETTTPETTTPKTTTGGAAPARLDSLMIMGALGAGGLIIGGGSVVYFRARSSGYENIKESSDLALSRERDQLKEISKILEERRKPDTSETAGTQTKKMRSARRRR